MAVISSPCCSWPAYASAPEPISTPSTASQAQYMRLPCSTRRTLPVKKRVKSRSVVTVASRSVEVEEAGDRVEVLLEHEHPLVLHDVADLARRVEDVAELARAGGADLDAGRVAALARALDAERALLADAPRPRPVAAHVRRRVELVLRQARLGP